MGHGVGRLARASRGQLDASERFDSSEDGGDEGGVGGGGNSYDLRNRAHAIRLRTRYAVRMQEMENQNAILQSRITTLEAEVNALRSSR